MENIYPTLIAGYTRKDSTPAREAVIYLLRNNNLQRPTEILHTLTSRFVPAYSYEEAQAALNTLLWDMEVELTPNRRIVLKESN